MLSLLLSSSTASSLLGEQSGSPSSEFECELCVSLLQLLPESTRGDGLPLLGDELDASLSSWDVLGIQRGVGI